MEKVVTVDESGDFKIPLEIKDSFNLKKDDKLLVFKDKNSIIIRKIQRPPLKDRFKDLSKSIADRLESKGVSAEAIDEAIQWARK